MAKRNRSSDSDSDSSEEEVKKRSGKVTSSKVVVSSDSDSSSDDDDEWNAKPKTKAKGKRGRVAKKPAPKPAKKKAKASDSDESDSSDDDEPRSSRGRGGREEKEEGEVEDMSDSDNDDDEDEIEEFNDGFDENLMGDEEDQRKLAQMTEKEREQELFNRSEKREVLRTRFEIERKLRLAKKQEMKKKSTDKQDKQDKHVSSNNNSKNDDLSAFTESLSTKRRRDMEDKRKVKDAIKGLQAEREKKKAKQKLRAADVYSSDSDSDSDAKPSRKTTKRSTSSSDSSSSSSISDDDSDTDTKVKSDKDSRRRDGNDRDKGRSSDAEREAEQFNFTLEHLNSIRLSRFKMEKWCHAPFFKEAVTGCFVRIGIGAGQNPAYVAGQIVDVVETPKIYALGKVRTNKGIKVKYGKTQERVYRLEYISNQEFNNQEWEKFISKMVIDKCDLPSREFVDRKKADIQRAINYQFSDADVEMIVAEKEKFKNKPVNFAMKKAQLMKEKEYAEINGDHEKAMKLTQEIDRLEDEAKRLDRIRTQNIAAISFINERNRMRNIKEAERAIAEAAKEGYSQKDDPFTRRKCNPTMMTKFKKGAESGQSADPSQRNAIEQTGSDSKDSSDSGNSKNTPMVNNVLKTTPANNNKSDTSSAVQDADDLFSAHNFDIKIDFDLPISSNSSSNTNSFSGGLLSNISNGKSSNGFGDARPNPLVSSGVNRRSLNLDEYKKKKGLI